MRKLLADIRAIYGSAWAFAFACPILFLIPVLAELAQHIVEMQIGMYTGPEGASAAADNPLRMQFGLAKTLAILLPGYWFVRYVMFGHSAAEARRIAWPAIALWGVLFLLNAAQLYWALYGNGMGSLIAATQDTIDILNAVMTVAFSVLGIYLTCWVVAWPLGNTAIGPIRSIAIMAGSFWYAVGLMFGGILPLMALHYALGYIAIYWTPYWLDWALNGFDAIVTGFLALTITGSSIYAASHAAARKSVDLLPEPIAPATVVA